MKKSKALSALCIIAAICLMTNVFALFAFAAESGVKVKVTLSSEGVLAVCNAKILVTDVDGDGSLTVNDALVITHTELYPTGSDGYENQTTQWGLSIKKLWGVENGGSYGYYINNNSAWSLTDVLNEGDALYAFSYKDAQYYSDLFSYFDKTSVDATAGESFEVVLSESAYDENWNPVQKPVEGAVITIDGVETAFVTDSEGKATVTVEDENRHIVSAKFDGHTITPPALTVEGLFTGLDYEYGNFYLLSDSVKQTGWQTVDGVKHYFKSNGAMARNEFVNDNGKFYYFDGKGVMLKGLKSVTNKKGNTYKYYFDADGVMYTGWKKTEANGKTYYYYFADNGVMLTGWQKLKRGNGNTYMHYFGDNGIMRTGWQNIKNSKGVAYKYYFGDNGVMRTGWQNIKNSKGVSYKYYFHTNGVMLTGWQNIKNSKGVAYKYYFGDNGVMRTGFQSIKNSKGKAYTYYFGTNGYMRTGWQKITNSKGKTYKYYFGDNGVMRTGLQTIGKYKYYFHTNGVMLTGWQKINGNKYFFDYDGVYISAKQIKAYVASYNKLLSYAKLGQYNSKSKQYIYAFDTLSSGTGRKLCCLEYDAGNDELSVSYIMDNKDFQSRISVKIQKNVTDKMEIIYAYKTIKNGKADEIGGATATMSKRAYTDSKAITVSKSAGTRYTDSDAGKLMSSQTAHALRELNDYITKNSDATLQSLGYTSYK